MIGQVSPWLLYKCSGRRDLLKIFKTYTGAEEMMVLSEMSALIPGDGIETLEDAKNAISQLIEGGPFWFIVLSALALGAGTMIGDEKSDKRNPPWLI